MNLAKILKQKRDAELRLKASDINKNVIYGESSEGQLLPPTGGGNVNILAGDNITIEKSETGTIINADVQDNANSIVNIPVFVSDLQNKHGYALTYNAVANRFELIKNNTQLMRFKADGTFKADGSQKADGIYEVTT